MMNDIEYYNNLFSKEYFGANAKIWSYDSTLSRLIIRLWWFKDGTVTNETFVQILGCEKISGPFFWPNSKIAFVKDGDKVLLIDRDAGFELTSSGGVGITNLES